MNIEAQLLRRCEQERDGYRQQARQLRRALQMWEKYAEYVAGKQIVAPLWDNMLFDEAIRMTREALKGKAKP